MRDPFVFDSRSEFCKSPYGAAPCGGRVTFHVRPLYAEGYSRCVLVAGIFQFRRYAGANAGGYGRRPHPLFRRSHRSPRAGADLVLFPPVSPGWFHPRVRPLRLAGRWHTPKLAAHGLRAMPYAPLAVSRRDLPNFSRPLLPPFRPGSHRPCGRPHSARELVRLPGLAAGRTRRGPQPGLFRRLTGRHHLPPAGAGGYGRHRPLPQSDF